MNLRLIKAITIGSMLFVFIAPAVQAQFQPDGSFTVSNHFHISPNGFVNGNLHFQKSWDEAGGIVRGHANGGLEFLSLDLNSVWQTRMVIDNAGNIGFGTNMPASKLHIVSGIERETLRIYKSGNYSNYLSIWQGTGGVVIDPIGTGLLYLGYDQATTVVIGKNGGELAIGTTTPSPGYKLTVKGAVHAEEVKVDLNVPGPDYVFESDYPLASLEDTKVYIEQNKHLPGIPSSDEMQQNGVNLLEMNMRLLEKIEELTLHLIAIKEENTTLKERVLKLEDNQPTQTQNRK